MYTHTMQKTSRRWFDPLSIILLAIATLLAAARLVVTEWLPDLQMVTVLTRLGVFVGLILGYSRFKKWGRTILTLGYSLYFIPIQVYLIVSPLLPWVERTDEMSTRLGAAIKTFFAQEPVEDPLLILVLLGVLLWIIAIYSNFALLRHQNGLAALLPSALFILVVQYNDHKLENPLWMLGFYFFFAFLLLARLDYLKRQEIWQKKHFFIVPDVKIDLNLFSTIAIAVLLLGTWNLPSSSDEWREIARWWDKTTYKFELSRRNLDNLFSAVDNPVQVRGSVLYGSALSLGERSYQGSNAIAVVDVPEDLENPPPRYYWRVRSYDTYANGQWSSSEGQTTELLQAQTPLLLPVDLESETAIFTFYNKAEQTVNLLTPHQSYWVDINAFATYTELPEGTLDLSLLRATERLLVDEQYSVRAALLAPTVAELRSAGTDYPDWVTERYLQLPDDLPVSIRELARELTRTRFAPYDKARVITTYLRTEIEYSDTIPAPPAGREPLEWFLFTWQEGYCNYSASAQVVMLRSLGIPARLVVGFAEGQKVEDGNYVVIQKNAHAWPEVYFPEIGWVEFEPTGNQTRLIRPLGEIESVDEDEILRSGLQNNEELLAQTPAPTPEPIETVLPEELDNVDASEKGRSGLLFWGMIVLIMVVAFFAIWQLNRKQVFLTSALRQTIRMYERRGLSAPAWLPRFLAWLEASAIQRAFQSINRGLKWLDDEIPQHLTPRERAERLAELLPEAHEEIMQLLGEHEQTLFTPEVGDIENAQRASRTITQAALKRRLQQSSKKTGP